MCNCKKTDKITKNNHKKSGKSGFTLVELCIVLAIVAITSVMIVSFSVSMKEFTISNQEEYDFIEDCSAIRNEVYKWVAENDVNGNDWDVSMGRTDSDFGKIIDGKLTLGGNHTVENLNTIEKIELDRYGDLIKCTIHRANSDSVKSYVFALRCTKSGGGA